MSLNVQEVNVSVYITTAQSEALARQLPTCSQRPRAGIRPDTDCHLLLP